MTHEEIEAAIERLRELGSRGLIFDTDIVDAVNDSTDMFEVRDTIIALLRQADPDTHMELPVDADGEVIHIWDELCGYGYPNGGVRCYAIVNERTILVQGDPSAYKDWLLWDAADCHHRKPTVEDVLRKYASIIIGVGEGPELENVLSECAGRIKEAVADE